MAHIRTDWALLGALAIVICIFVYQQLALSPSATTEAVRQSGVEAARAAAASASTVIAKCFSNMSGYAPQEFFGRFDGGRDHLRAREGAGFAHGGADPAFEFKGKPRMSRPVALSA